MERSSIHGNMAQEWIFPLMHRPDCTLPRLMLKSPPPMQLAHLSLTNYRNFSRLEIDLPSGSTILVGANAQGKTSLLEAIYYLSCASSPHVGSDRQLINFLALNQSPPFARIVAEFHRQDRLRRIEIRIILDTLGHVGEQRLRKEILINGLKQRVSDLAGEFNAVMFLPQDIQIIEGSPSFRRHYLDATLSQADPTYAEAHGEYGKVLTQRNALLKQLQERNHPGDEIAFWDERLADLGASLIRSRAVGLYGIEQVAAQIHSELTRNNERLHLEYQPSFDPIEHPKAQLGLPINMSADWTGISRETIRKGLLNALVAGRREEIQRGMTLLGPHRDDFSVLSNAIDLRLYGSRGQNRTALLAIKLGEIEWLHQCCGEWPVLLLDEVLAELDPTRRDDLLGRVRAVNQTILTSADLMMVNQQFRQHATIWQITAGRISPLAEEPSPPTPPPR